MDSIKSPPSITSNLQSRFPLRSFEWDPKKEVSVHIGEALQLNAIYFSDGFGKRLYRSCVLLALLLLLTTFAMR